MPNIIFLEIEHTLIPTPCMFIDKMASFRRIMSNVSCAILNEICLKTNSKIVCNSIHNYHLNDDTGTTLKADLVLAGISAEHFMFDWRTEFTAPNVSISKEDAVKNWLLTQTEVYDWVAIDSFPYKGFEDRSFVVNRNYGLDYGLYKKIMILLGGGGISLLWSTELRD